MYDVFLDFLCGLVFNIYVYSLFVSFLLFCYSNIFTCGCIHLHKILYEHDVQKLTKQFHLSL